MELIKEEIATSVVYVLIKKIFKIITFSSWCAVKTGSRTMLSVSDGLQNNLLTIII